jgi:hypothetical protein
MKDCDKHPARCRVCGDALPLRDEPRGRPRLYCPAGVSPCKERQRILNDLANRVTAWSDAGRIDGARRIAARAERLRISWQRSSSGEVER